VVRRLICGSVFVAVALAVIPSSGSAVVLEQSLNPPSWAKSNRHCAKNLSTAQMPSGVVGYIGYNVYELDIKQYVGVNCATAKELALQDWEHARSAQGFHWKYVKAWRSTSGGSGYIGDFVGTKGHARIEYLAGH
jgi:hypothetical protein